MKIKHTTMQQMDAYVHLQMLLYRTRIYTFVEMTILLVICMIRLTSCIY